MPPISTLFPYTTLFRSDPITFGHGLPILVLNTIDGGNQEHFEVVTRQGSRNSFENGIEQAEVILSIRLTLLRSEEHTSELQSHSDPVCRLRLEKKNPRQPLQPPPPSGAPAAGPALQLRTSGVRASVRKPQDQGRHRHAPVLRAARGGSRRGRR